MSVGWPAHLASYCASVRLWRADRRVRSPPPSQAGKALPVAVWHGLTAWPVVTSGFDKGGAGRSAWWAFGCGHGRSLSISLDGDGGTPSRLAGWGNGMMLVIEAGDEWVGWRRWVACSGFWFWGARVHTYTDSIIHMYMRTCPVQLLGRIVCGPKGARGY